VTIFFDSIIILPRFFWKTIYENEKEICDGLIEMGPGKDSETCVLLTERYKKIKFKNKTTRHGHVSSPPSGTPSDGNWFHVEILFDR